MVGREMGWRRSGRKGEGVEEEWRKGDGVEEEW